MKVAVWGVTARRQREEGHDKAAKRGGEPECDEAEEEGRTDAIEELGNGLVRQPVERVHFLDGDLEGLAEILAGALALVAAGGSGEAVDVPVDEAVPEECGRGGVAVHDGGAVGSVSGVRGQWPSLGCAVVGAAPGVAVGRGVGAVALAVSQQLLKEVVESLREVHHPGEVEVGVCLGEGGTDVVAEGLECAMFLGAEDCTDVQCHAPLPEARVADGVLEGRLTVLNAVTPLTYEVVVEGEQVVWRPGRAGEEASQVAAEPGEGRRCAAAEGAEDVHDASALSSTGGQPAGALDTGAVCRQLVRQEAHQAVLEERLERRLDAALRMLITALVTYLVVCLVALLVTHLVGTLHGVALPTGATDVPAVPAVEPSAVPGVVEAPAVEEMELVVEAFDDVEQQAEQSVGVAGVEQASRVGVEVAGVDAICVAVAE
ncbi:sulfate transporter antisigma-factor antagonist STAS, putative [Babesia ovata]|uniref:Sulfate transporter antisigma-factor antagonist STAS, putative n=1 Tax=Babesia ovata TaxID=189622 RepID=A0A2H6KIM5_9APIC|nr:sulfate transporter antisigma-factor antagonist STAS, putative [Babesia ovata]GBE62831.1 sulfate transporter antisigma-factor antagonist STAS, putative [Babesia ovata]